MTNESIVILTADILKKFYKNYEVKIEINYIDDEFISLNIQLKLLYGVNVYFSINQWIISLIKKYPSEYYSNYVHNVLETSEKAILDLFRKEK